MSPPPAKPAALPVPRTRHAPKGEKRREQLLGIALEVFSREGYGAASIATIAELAGISVAGLLHHFPSKVALLMGVLTHRDGRHRLLEDPFIEAPTLRNFLGFLQQLNRANAETVGVIRAFSILNAESLVDSHPAWEWFQTRYSTIHERMRGRLEQLVANGQVRPDADLNAVIHQLLAMMDGLQLQWLRFPEQVDLVARFDSYIAQVERDLRPTQAL
ncbi:MULTISPECIES: TetR/AcrR family transcriptional regulator [Pseudomonas]|uniref:TetR/AcrR family transcriptional regulator n=1 Tax=Pseudomonas quercus TaxID=2722792 RepID=A0ABX0YIV7_9PSED|nr:MULTISPECIES: TetR/AcrR family transcriptional regulator [Pseudomonas]MBF7143810.1 TetR/AcrR family transcriptional regulator [Pseudomonas sp. LY10J]NJP02111.1 TetR/AcrR family transcriptional regulator [Pseudomonas quercus]